MHVINRSYDFNCSYDSEPRGEPAEDRSWGPPHPSQDADPIAAGYEEGEEHPKE